MAQFRHDGARLVQQWVPPSRRHVRRDGGGPFGWLDEHPGSPLGHGYPSGSSLRADGETHREAWMRILRSDPCSYCGRPGGTVDHVEPKSRPARGLGGAHSWANYVGACDSCNSRKSNKKLLLFLAARRGALSFKLAA